jgi:hypothetical protein
MPCWEKIGPENDVYFHVIYVEFHMSGSTSVTYHDESTWVMMHQARSTLRGVCMSVWAPMGLSPEWT